LKSEDQKSLKNNGENLKAKLVGKFKKNLMEVLSVIAQLIVAISVLIVWVFRFDNIVKEFKQYELSDLTRMIVGATSISDTAYCGICILQAPALVMAFLMLSAQYFHSKNNPY
jgi:hypothetical protein